MGLTGVYGADIPCVPCVADNAELGVLAGVQEAAKTVVPGWLIKPIMLLSG